MLKSFAGFFLIILLIASLWIPVDLPFSIESTALVYPIRSWTLQKNPDGTMVSSSRNYDSGQLEDFNTYQFERGDVVSIRFAKDHQLDGRIDSAGLVATIASNTLSQQLIQLENQVEVSQAQLQSARTGQKVEIQQEAEEQVRLMKETLVLARQRLDRANKTHVEGLIATADLEKTKNEFEQAKINIRLAEEKLAVVATGEKPEDIALIEARINTLLKEIDFLKNTSGLYQIYAPFAGRLRYENDNAGDRLIIDDTDTYIFRIPVKIKDRKLIEPGVLVEWTPLHQDTVLNAVITGWGTKVEILNQEQVIMARAEMPGNVAGIFFGMTVKCSINLGKVTPMEYIRRSMNTKLR